MKPGRNDACPCGSGKKYKHCCGLQPAAAPAAAIENLQDIGALVALVNQDRLGDAEHQALALLKAQPNAGMLWKILSVALVRQGKDALPALRRTTELMPQDAEAHRNLGATLHDQGQWAASLESLRRALEIRPDDVEALVDAGNALRGLGRALEAVPLYQRALARNSQLVEAQNNLGNAFLELGRHGDAVGCYRLALAIRPNDAQILCNLGHSLAALGKREEAVAVFSEAVELEPQSAENHYQLGNALFELRRIDDAAASYRQALSLQPAFAPALLSLGLTLRQQRRPAEAEVSCRAALAIDPNYVEALSFLGELQADRGQFSAAEELFQRAIAISPDVASAFASISTHRRMTHDDTAWLQGATALLAKLPPLTDAISLHYALGKYYDDVRLYDKAFGHFRQANELTKCHGIDYDGPRLTRRVEQIIRRFDPTFMRQCRDFGSDSELPVFIVGMPRSGTSLTEQILASHPAVFGAGEVVFWNAAYSAYQHAELAGKVAADLIPGMARDYLDRLTVLGGDASRVVDKMPANFLYAGLIHAALPRARIIHMQRQPIDTCLSIYFQNFFNMGPYAHDLDNLAHYYGEYRRITEHWRAVLPATTLLEVPYEALIDAPEAWTRRMLDFIDLPWDPQCLDFHQTDRVVITASKWQVRQKISKASAGRWRNYQQFVGPLRPLMAQDQRG